MKKEADLLKKQMTKKAYNELRKQNRSTVGLGRNLGTRYMTGPKDYSRSRSREELRRRVKEVQA